MKVPVYNIQGEKVEEMELPSSIFEVEKNSDLVYQVATSQMANQRKVIAHTKHRGEVSGGGKKPWAQKHTGRARHGSIRSPLWRKGGVAFGPRSSRVFKKTINAKMRKKALFIVLSEKAKNNFFVVVDSLALQSPKTKLLYGILQKLPSANKTSILLLPAKEKNLSLAARNIPSLSVLGAKDLNVLALLSSQFVIIPKEGIAVIEKTFHAV